MTANALEPAAPLGNAMPSFLQPLKKLNLARHARPSDVISDVQDLVPGARIDGKLQHDFFMEKQSQANWCWAAVGVALNRFLQKPAVTQCEAVQVTLHPASVNCCQSPSNSTCNTTAKISTVLGVLSIPRLANPAQPQAPLAFCDIQKDIARNRPIVCAMMGGGTFHFVAIVAWATIGGTPYVIVDDPAVGARKERPLAKFQTEFDGRVWFQTTRLQ